MKRTTRTSIFTLRLTALHRLLVKGPILILLIVMGLMTGMYRGQATTDRVHATRPVDDATLPVLDAKASLSDYLAYAALNNPGLKAAFTQWKAALEKIPQAHALPDPMFSYTYMIRAVETRVGPQRQKFAFSQTFPWFGKRGLRQTAAAQAAESEHQRYEAEKLALFYKVKSVYYELYYLQRALAVTGDNLKLVKYLEGVARSKYKTGIARYGDVIKAQVMIGELEDRLRTLEDLRQPLTVKLNAALNRPSAAPLPWPDSISIPAMDANESQLESRLKTDNPQLKALADQTLLSDTRIQLARKADQPNVTLGVQYIDTGGALMPDTPDNGKNPLGVSISLNIPLWRDKYSAARRQAALEKIRAENALAEQENELHARLALALFGFRDAGRKIGLYRDTLLPKAEQSLNVNQQAFENGRADFLDLIDSQKTLLEYQLAYERARADQAGKLAEIEMLVGSEVGDNSTPDSTQSSDSTHGDSSPRSDQPAGIGHSDFIHNEPEVP